MSDETLVVVGILVGIVVMVIALVRYQRGNSHLQVLTFRQDGVAWGFSYGLPITRKPYVNREVKGYLTRLLGGETRVIRDRVRTRAGLASPSPGQGPPSE